MTRDEASPSLKPRKHSWYAACFLALFLTVMADFAQALLRLPYPTDPMQRLGYIAELFGSSVGTGIVCVPPLIFLLALLFFFDGWISRTIVGMGLSLWMLMQAVQLGRTVRSQLVHVPSPTTSHVGQSTISVPDSNVKSTTPPPRMKRSAQPAPRHRVPPANPEG